MPPRLVVEHASVAAWRGCPTVWASRSGGVLFRVWDTMRCPSSIVRDQSKLRYATTVAYEASVSWGRFVGELPQIDGGWTRPGRSVGRGLTDACHRRHSDGDAVCEFFSTS